MNASFSIPWVNLRYVIFLTPNGKIAPEESFCGPWR